MISANTTRLIRGGLTALWGKTTAQAASVPPPVGRSVWDAWWPWLAVQFLVSFLSYFPLFVAYILKAKISWGQAQPKIGQPQARKDDEESGRSDASWSPSISLTLTKEEILNSVNLYKEKFKTMGIDIINHGVLQHTSDNIGFGRYSHVLAVERTWPGHRVKVPLCVKIITYNRPTAVFQTCVEVLNLAELSGIPGVPRVVAVCLASPPLIVMTQHSKITLDVLLYERNPSDSFLLEVSHQLCVTLDLIHRRKRIHNDVKGNNICVDVKPRDHPKVTLIDYGLMTREGEKLFETPSTERDRLKAVEEHNRRYPWYDLGLYLGGPASPRTDIYSVAVLLRQVMRVMLEPSAALQACVRDGLGAPNQRPPLTHFKAVLRASITALNNKRH